MGILSTATTDNVTTAAADYNDDDDDDKDDDEGDSSSIVTGLFSSPGMIYTKQIQRNDWNFCEFEI